MIMTCGHTANGKDMVTGKPVCVICPCETQDKEPDLSNREAKCIMCDEKQASNVKLPFFEYRPNEPTDQYYSGCRGFD